MKNRLHDVAMRVGLLSDFNKSRFCRRDKPLRPIFKFQCYLLLLGSVQLPEKSFICVSSAQKQPENLALKH